MIKMAYYNDCIRCYSDGRIERKFKKSNQHGKAGTWQEVTQTTIDEGGYLRIGIDGKPEPWHRIVWEAFNGNIPDGLTINHKDEIKTNNSLENLELMTIGDNNRYSKNKPVIGINIKTGEQIEFPSTQEAGRNGFYSGNICKCIKGRIKTYKGYKWYYKDQISS